MDGERRRIETCWMWLACGLAFLMLANACSRSRYRRLADAEAVDLIREKSDHPHWDLPDYHVYVDPRSRMFDPFDPDGPPMPPDDPTSHKLMRFVDGKRGFPQWHRNGDTPFVENPTWLDYLPMDERGVLKLDSENVVELALIHSPTYQRLQEEIYLSALDVSFERFRFDTQFFAGYQTFLTADGRQRRQWRELPQQLDHQPVLQRSSRYGAAKVVHHGGRPGGRHGQFPGLAAVGSR